MTTALRESLIGHFRETKMQKRKAKLIVERYRFLWDVAVSPADEKPAIQSFGDIGLTDAGKIFWSVGKIVL